MISVARMGLLPILLLYALFPLTYSITKWGIQYGPFSLYVALRMLFSGAVIIGWYLLFNRKAMVIEKQDWYYFFMLGFIAFCVSALAESCALSQLPIVKVSLYFALAPFFTALFAALHKLEIITPRKIVGLVVGFCGFIPQLFVDNKTGCISNILTINTYDFIMLIACAAYAYGWILIKKLSRRTEYEDAWVNGVGMLLGGGLSLLFFAATNRAEWCLSVTNCPQFVFSAVLLSIVGMFCYLLYTSLLHHFSTTLVSFFSFLEVPFALFFGVLFLCEKINYVSFLSTAIITLGLYIFYKEELRLRA